MSEELKLKILRTQPLLSGLNDRQIEYLSQITEEITLHPGEYAIIENEVSKDIYFILTGVCEVLKNNYLSGDAFVINEIKEGGVFGEVAFIDEKPRSTSIRAKTLTVLLKLKSKDLKLEKKKWNSWLYKRKLRESTYDALYENIIKESFSRLRKTNQNYVLAVQEQINEIELQNDFGYFFLVAMTIFSTYSLLFIYLSPKRIFNDPFLILLTSLLLIVPILTFILKRNIPLKSVGLTWKNGLKSFLESSLILFLGVISVWAIYYYTTGSAILFEKSIYESFLNLFKPITIAILIYIFTLEFALRGVILNSLKKFLNDTQGTKTVFLSAFFLSPLNLQEGLAIFIFKFYTDLFLGFLYLRQGSLVGVTLIHFLLVHFFRFYY